MNRSLKAILAKAQREKGFLRVGRLCRLREHLSSHEESWQRCGGSLAPVQRTKRVLIMKWRRPWLVHIASLHFMLPRRHNYHQGPTCSQVYLGGRIWALLWQTPELPAHAGCLHFLLLFLGIGIRQNYPILSFVMPCSIHFLQNSLESSILGSLSVFSGHCDNCDFLPISG